MSTGYMVHGYITTRRDLKVVSGVRFVSFHIARQVSCIPSYTMTAGGHVFSVRYTGQPKTCRLTGTLPKAHSTGQHKIVANCLSQRQ